MTPDVYFLVVAYVCHVHQNFGYVRDHIRRFYGDC